MDWILIREPLTRPGVNLDEKMSISSSTPQHGRYTNSSLLEGDVKVRKCLAILSLTTCMSRKWMSFILTLSFNMTAEIEITKHTVLRPTFQTRTCIVVLPKANGK